MKIPKRTLRLKRLLEEDNSCIVAEVCFEVERETRNDGHVYKKTRRTRFLFTSQGDRREAYKRALRIQGNACAICRREPQAGKTMAIDHDHKTGEIRGLLCNKCNISLGGFRDDPDLLQGAIEYLKSPPLKGREVLESDNE